MEMTEVEGLMSLPQGLFLSRFAVKDGTLSSMDAV